MIKNPEKYKTRVKEYIQKYALIDNSRKISEASTKAEIIDREDEIS